MTNLKLSAKMHVFIIISAVIIAVGIAVGLICQFAADGYFNYGAEYKSYQSVVVDYAFVDYSADDKVLEICDKAFNDAGVSYYSSVRGDTDDGGEIIFKFSNGTETDKISAAVSAINSAFPDYEGINLSNAYLHKAETKFGGFEGMKYVAIALSAVAAFQFLYYIIRYKLTMACAAFLANIHNLALYVSLIAITRIPVGASAFVFGVLTVILTMIGCSYIFSKLRAAFKDESLAKLTDFEKTDKCAVESIITVAAASVCMCVAAAVLLVLLSISALSLQVIITPVVLAVIGAAVSVYGTAFFTPSVYTRIKKSGDAVKAKIKIKKTAAKADK